MNVIERTPASDRPLPHWPAINPKPAPILPAIRASLRSIWTALRRERPERRYERRILKRLARGDLTNTLGVEIRDETLVRASSERWLSVLVQLGLAPDHICVEYGCGSLWCAEPIIRYLGPGRFMGLDTTTSFYELGRQRLHQLLDTKEVGLSVISRRSLRAVAALKPDFVYAHRVLHHVPRHDLPRFVRSVSMLLNERTTLIIENTRAAPGESQAGARYGTDDIQPHLPQDWHCRQESFGFLIRYREL